MGLEFQNQYHNNIWIALVYGDTACGSKLRKQGWRAVDPGQTRSVWNVNLQTVNRFASFYAQEFRNGVEQLGTARATSGTSFATSGSTSATRTTPAATSNQTSWTSISYRQITGITPFTICASHWTLRPDRSGG
jgi:hypothetical protein